MPAWLSLLFVSFAHADVLPTPSVGAWHELQNVDAQGLLVLAVVWMGTRLIMRISRSSTVGTLRRMVAEKVFFRRYMGRRLTDWNGDVQTTMLWSD